MATLNDLAQLAGVDASTVSRVLRGDPNQAVRPETRKRILAAADKLNYRPNQIARALRTQKTNTIGLIAPRFSDFAFTDLLDAIQAATLQADHGLLVVGWDVMGDNLTSKSELLSHLIHDGIVDGLLVAFATIEDDFAPALQSSPIPIVLVNRKASGVIGSVTAQDSQAARAAVEHLVKSGHSEIGYIGLEPGTSTSADRLDGFLSAMAEMGLESREEWMAIAGQDLDSGRTALSSIVERSTLTGLPTALLVASIRPAVLVISELADRRIKVPEEVSVISIGDNLFAEVTTPKLTTVQLPFEKMGWRSVDMLLAAINGEEPFDVRLADPPNLVVRESTGPPRLIEQGVG